MSLFDQKKYLRRRELKETLKKAPPRLPGVGGRFSTKERVEMEKEVFGKEYGEYISRGEYGRAVKKLEDARYRAKTSADKLKIDRRIKFLKKIEEK